MQRLNIKKDGKDAAGPAAVLPVLLGALGPGTATVAATSARALQFANSSAQNQLKEGDKGSHFSYLALPANELLNLSLA